MPKFSDPERGILGILSRLGDIFILNILFLVCSLPVFTIGASLTALCTVNLQFCEGTENYTIKGFFKAFRSEFRQSTAIWLVILAIIGILWVDLNAIRSMEGPAATYFRVIIFVCCVFLLIFSTYVFFLQAKFINRVPATMKNAVLMAIANFPKTIWMLLLDAAILFILFFNMTTFAVVTLVFAIGGFAGLNFIDAHLLYPAIRKMEQQVLAASPACVPDHTPTEAGVCVPDHTPTEADISTRNRPPAQAGTPAPKE